MTSTKRQSSNLKITLSYKSSPTDIKFKGLVLKKLWRCVSGRIRQNLDQVGQLGYYSKLATVTKFAKADVSSVSPSSERIKEL